MLKIKAFIKLLTQSLIYTFKHANDSFVELNSFFKTVF